MNGLKKFARGLVEVQYALSAALALGLALLVVYQVILRYVLHAPLMGIEELMAFPIIWLYFLGGANASYERTHIECGVLTLYMKKPRTNALFNFCKALFSAGICAWMLYWAYWYLEYSFTRWKLSDLLFIPWFYGESAYFVGIALMIVYAIRDMVEFGIEFFRTFSGKPAQEGGKA